jgi:hypothetical protein
VQAPSFDLAVTKHRVESRRLDDPMRFGETLNYDIRASNFGPSRATDVARHRYPGTAAGPDDDAERLW